MPHLLPSLVLALLEFLSNIIGPGINKQIAI